MSKEGFIVENVANGELDDDNFPSCSHIVVDGSCENKGKDDETNPLYE